MADGKGASSSSPRTLVFREGDHDGAHHKGVMSGEWFAVTALGSCSHAGGISHDTSAIPPLGSKCKRCDEPVENWTCLTCNEVYCGRYAEAHMAEHSQALGHALVISSRDLSVWCFQCDAYVDAFLVEAVKGPFEAFHKQKFGVTPTFPAMERDTSSQYELK